MSEMDAIIKEFLVESRENLDQLDRDLVDLEKNPTDKETLARVFRTIHSLKGATGFLGFSKLEGVAHAGENLLSRLRDGVLVINPPITTGLLALVDCIRKILSAIEQTGAEPDTDYKALIDELTRLQGNASPKKPPSGVPSTSSGSPGPESGPANDDAGVTTGSSRASAPAEADQSILDPIQGQKESASLILSASNVRVDVGQLDNLMDLVSELVLTRNEMLQFTSAGKDAGLVRTSQRLNFITTELQEGIMKVRMQPLDNVLNRFPRMVRDLALQKGKSVRLEMEGREIELDKTVIEAIKDPLLHLVRNAIDHGLETPDARVADKKNLEGRLLMRAFHENGQIIIEISDDGAGIHLARVKRKAIERGLVTQEQAGLMGDQEALNLIFLPGFSTAEEVTSTSGRGVGMDVVKTNIEKIGGKVSIQSQMGLGTTLRIRLPLTLAIMPALLVTTGCYRYAIPQVSVVELLRIEKNDEREKIEKIGDISVFRLRGNLLPLVNLSDEFKIENEISNPPLNPDDSIHIVILEADDKKFGLVVDEVNDTQEIVVKPLGKQLSGISTFAGATIMGNGQVVLILDVVGFAIHSGALSELRSTMPSKAQTLIEESPVEKDAYLLFSGADDIRMAIRLSEVTRLEGFPVSSLEHTGEQDVVQYRGEILPLVNISKLLPERRSRPRGNPLKPMTDDTVQVIVYSKDGWNVGLVVDRILDTIEQSTAELRPPSRKGVIASTVIQGRVTEILDLPTICRNLELLGAQKNILMEAKV